VSGSTRDRKGAYVPNGPANRAVEADGGSVPVPAASDPSAEREARWRAREARRGPRSERPEVNIPSRRKRLPLETPPMRGVASAGIVGIAVASAAIMSAQGVSGWLIGLVVSIVSLVLAAVLWSRSMLPPRPRPLIRTGRPAVPARTTRSTRTGPADQPATDLAADSRNDRAP
jgi:hypothetical protein